MSKEFYNIKGKTMRIVLVLFVMVILTINFSLAQEIKANVTVNTEQIASENLYYIATMANDVENYINNTKFLDNYEWEGDPIPVEISIVLSGGNNNRFGARMFIASKRMLDGPKGEESWSVELRMVENKWKFEYSQGANFTYNTMRFDPFVSMLDYYMLIVIGFDLDSYGELDGSKAYDKAKLIFSNGVTAGADGFETHSTPGQYTKYNIVSELTDMRYDEFRKLIFSYYVDGLDLMYQEPKRALENLAYVIERMAEFKNKKMSSGSVLLQIFFDTKARELASIFNGYEERKVFNYLMDLDPANTIIYQESRDGDFTN